jgi:RNA polymerase sigma-70 factor (ECF subfamily)
MAIELANLGENQAFERLAEPFRREIKLHCYRMLGSLHEAEDAVQDTYLRAWRSFSSFEAAGSSDERGPFRAWLYRIATNACLNALAARKYVQRLLPNQKTLASVDALGRGGPKPIDVAWLEPFPDSNLEGIVDDAPNPEARYSSREAVQLAFVAAIQLLPPRQRAALLLCDVIGWTATEVASLLGGSTASINSALQRGRATLANHYTSRRSLEALHPTPAQQVLLQRYLDVWQRLDSEGLAALLKEDVTVTMPPWLEWFAGRGALMSFFRNWKCNGLRLVPTGANGQPAFAVYERTSSQWAARSIHVLTLEHEMISTITVFGPPIGPNLFQAYGLPLILPDAASTELSSMPLLRHTASP